MTSQVTMVRIYIRESEHGRRTTMMREILDILHDKHRVKGVTVFRGIVGFGADGEVRAGDLLRLNPDLPVVIEFFDSPEVVKGAIALLADVVPDGHIVSWSASCQTMGGEEGIGGASI